MALIVFHGSKAIDAALKFKKAMDFPAWDLSPDVADSVRVDVVPCQTPAEAIAFVEKCANDPELDWIDPDGWTAHFMMPVEDPYRGGIEGVPL